MQLQVCLHDNNATTFQFVNPAGPAEQLKQLYMDLVKSNVISTEEFWSDHATEFINKQQEMKSASQEVGISASFLVCGRQIYYFSLFITMS